MLISYDWLVSLCPEGLPGPQETAAILTGLGLEVDGVTEVGACAHQVVVAEVRRVAPHPKADRLRRVEVDDGRTVHSVVCGAANVPPPGGKVLLAPVGTELPGGLRIEARTIRGVVSAGMLCSEAELDLGPDAEGIVVLPPDAPVGRSLAAYVPGAHDHVIELSVTPNRPDALGHVGVARDLAAKLGRPLDLAPFPGLPAVPEDPGLVALAAPDRCGRYIGVAFEAVHVGPSPLWLRVRLHRVGLRPISAPVDVTNFVLMEWGQPLHAFDRDRLAGGRVQVRRARSGERLALIDGAQVQCAPEDLVIADDEGPAALAGVMGGAASAVGPSTGRMLLEAAYFEPRGIRRTARRLGLSTDSSHRFERGVDHGEGLTRAAGRAAALLAELCGARAVARVDLLGNRPARPVIRFRPRRCAALLGVEVPAEEAQAHLRALGVEVTAGPDGAFACRPPTHRPDLGREEDLIEEVIRLRGLDTIPPAPVAPSRPLQAAPPDPARRLREAMQDGCAAAGFCEVVGWAFDARKHFEFLAPALPPKRFVELENPLRAEPTVMRPHLLPGLLRGVAAGAVHGKRAIRLFEVGRTYRWPAAGEEPPGPARGRLPEDGRLPQERLEGAVVYAAHGAEPAEVGRAVGDVLVRVLARLGFDAQTASPSGEPVPGLHPGMWASVRLEGNGEVGRFGIVHPDLVGSFDLSGWTVAFGQVDLFALPPAKRRRYRPIPRHPGSARDLSLAVPQGIHAAAIRDALVEIAGACAGEVRLDVGDAGEPMVEIVEEYHGEDSGLGEGMRSLLLRLHYRAAGRSVRDEEVEAIHEAIVCRLLERFADRDPGRSLRRR